MLGTIEVVVTSLPFDYSNLVTWLLVLTGWFILFLQAQHTENRKETRVKLAQISENLNLLEEAAIEYHTSQTRNSKNAEKIRWILKTLSRDIKSSALKLPDSRKRVFREFKQSITLNNFDTADHSQLPIEDELIEEIKNCADELRDALEQSFSNKYPGKFLNRRSKDHSSLTS